MVTMEIEKVIKEYMIMRVLVNERNCESKYTKKGAKVCVMKGVSVIMSCFSVKNVFLGQGMMNNILKGIRRMLP